MSQIDTIQSWRNNGHKIVFTNGVFDILHVGHLYCLEAAAEFGSKLVVAINDDESVRRLNKGPERPINSASNRAHLLSGLSCVDLVIIFSEDTPLEAIYAVKPDVLIKGDDYDSECTDPSNPKYIVGSNEVKKNGGEVFTIPLLPGHSSTNILKSR
tara:strand:- start:1617 stop:2084 length:468 start_codon:yes stop_codon:yes gene_type:complete